MTQTVWDVGGDVRKALRSIVGDPQLGTAVLADPHVLTNLLKDLLPDLPREAALLVAAAQCDLVSVLSGHLDCGLDLGTSSRLAAGWFAERMPFTDDACAWVVRELAIALGADPSAIAGTTLPDTVPAGPEDLFEATASVGIVVGWGDNDEGEIDVPAGLHHVVAAAAGWYHSLAVTSAGQVIAWGSTADSLTNVPAGLGGVTAIAAGRLHSLALTIAGSVIAWGSNGYGQVRVPTGLEGVTSVSAGAEHSLAVSEGKVVAWGGNGCGQADVPRGLPAITA
ncbi:MAG: RCC1 domain-containing protein, partial [Streptosporangiaceae bacterium]